MIKSAKFKKYMSMIVALLLCLAFCGITALAEGDYSVSLNVTDSSKADKVFQEDGTGLSGLTWSGGGDSKGTLQWDGGQAFSEKPDKERKKEIKAFFNKINKAGLSADATNQITDMLSQVEDGVDVDMSIYLTVHIFSETKGDVVGGMKILSGTLPYINIFIGIGAILLISLLVLSTVIDLACIGLPAIRDYMLAKADTGEGGGGGTANKPKAITYAAWATINEVEGGESGKGSGKNAYLTYLKKRVFDYLVLGVCIAFLIFGGFANVISAFLEIGSGLAN